MLGSRCYASWRPCQSLGPRRLAATSEPLCARFARPIAAGSGIGPFPSSERRTDTATRGCAIHPTARQGGMNVQPPRSAQQLECGSRRTFRTFRCRPFKLAQGDTFPPCLRSPQPIIDVVPLQEGWEEARCGGALHANRRVVDLPDHRSTFSARGLLMSSVELNRPTMWPQGCSQLHMRERGLGQHLCSSEHGGQATADKGLARPDEILEALDAPQRRILGDQMAS